MFIPILLLSGSTIFSQWQGIYTGNVLGDNVTMQLEDKGNNEITGWMKDSQQQYTIAGTKQGESLVANAVETTYNLNFVLTGTMRDTLADFVLSFEYNGEKSSNPFTLKKQADSNNFEIKGEESISINQHQSIPKGATRDQNLVGKWTKNETYQSGYGDGSMSGNITSSLILLSDGSLGNGGSNATMSGENYYGSSGSSQVAIIPNVTWYTIGNQLYLSAIENGKTQEALLGQYYVEDNKLLITGSNGVKIFMTR